MVHCPGLTNLDARKVCSAGDIVDTDFGYNLISGFTCRKALKQTGGLNGLFLYYKQQRKRVHNTCIVVVLAGEFEASSYVAIFKIYCEA